MTTDYDGNVGISNTSAKSLLHLGNSDVSYTALVLIFGKNTGSGRKNAFIGYSYIFYFLIGDYGNTNGTTI